MDNAIIAFVSAHEGTVFLTAVGLILIVEALAPLRASVSGQGQRWLSNIGLGLLNTLLFRLATPLLAVGAALLALERGWGLFNTIALSPLLTIPISVLVLDLLFYGCHRFYHASDLAWRFHVVHHTDRAIDFTTGFRFHPFEALANGAVSALVSLALGLPPAGILLHQMIVSAETVFGHSNARTPEWLDRVLALVLVTPRFHHVHHAADGAECHSNFGIVFTFWDRLFGTHCRRDGAWLEAMPIGLEGCESQRRFHLPWLLAQPFLSTETAPAVKNRPSDSGDKLA